MSQSARDGAGESAEVALLPESERHRLLADDRRRMTLDVLGRRTSPVDLEDLAASIADRETTGDTVEQITGRLHHAHLPMMDELGVIDYEPDANRIESCPHRHDS